MTVKELRAIVASANPNALVVVSMNDCRMNGIYYEQATKATEEKMIAERDWGEIFYREPRDGETADILVFRLERG